MVEISCFYQSRILSSYVVLLTVLITDSLLTPLHDSGLTSYCPPIGPRNDPGKIPLEIFDKWKPNEYHLGKAGCSLSRHFKKHSFRWPEMRPMKGSRHKQDS